MREDLKSFSVRLDYRQCDRAPETKGYREGYCPAQGRRERGSGIRSHEHRTASRVFQEGRAWLAGQSILDDRELYGFHRQSQRPQVGKSSLSAIKAIDVEKWLGGITRKDGEPASPATKAKIRNIISALFY